jgi:hypothetical protein
VPAGRSVAAFGPLGRGGDQNPDSDGLRRLMRTGARSKPSTAIAVRIIAAVFRIRAFSRRTIG